MDWYAVQAITGKKHEAAAALRDFGVETLEPKTPMRFRLSQKLKLENRLLLPGYVVARMSKVDFFRCQREPRIERMMIRISGASFRPPEYFRVPQAMEQKGKKPRPTLDGAIFMRKVKKVFRASGLFLLLSAVILLPLESSEIGFTAQEG